MPRKPKTTEEMGHTERCVPLTDDLDMIRLKKLVADLPPERQDALQEFLVDQTQEEEA